MKSRCTVCNHHLIDDINLAILSRDYTLDELSQNFGPSRSAFHRHGRHLETKMARSLERLENNRKQVSFLKLSAFLDHVQARVEAAAADDDTDRVYKGSHIGCRLIHQINKMDVPLEPDTAYRLLSSPGPASRDSLLPAGPQIIADLHQALRDKTLAPCPPPAENEAQEAAESQAAEQPGPDAHVAHVGRKNAAPPAVLPQPLATRESKKQRRQHAKAARQKQRLLRKKLRQEKHLFQEKNLFQNFGARREFEAPPDPDENVANVANVGRDPQGGESQSAASPAVQELAPDHSPAHASWAAKAPKPERDKSATDAKRQRRLLRKMLRNQKHISKAKKLLQNLTPGLESAPPPAALANSAALETLNPELETAFSDSWPLPTDHSFTDPWLSPDLDPWLSPEPGPCSPEPKRVVPPTDHLETQNLEPDTSFSATKNQEPKTNNDPCLLETENRKPETENQLLKGPKPPPPYDATAARADELFEISHGYKRGHPPKPIPNRRLEEDFHSRSIFGDVKNVLKYM